MEINGQLLTPGTSLFHTRTNEVFWYRGMKDGQVQLESFRDDLELPLSMFRDKVAIGDLIIEI